MVSPEVVIVTEWTLVALAYIFLGLRLAVRIKQRQTNLIWSEVWLVLGALWLLGLVICDTLTYHAGAMSEFVVTTVEIMKIRFATNYLFDAGLYFPKLSMLTMYLHILPRYERLHRLALYFVGVFTVVSFLITVFMDTFLCGADPSVNWSMDPGSCMVFSSELLFRLNWSLCFTTEAMLFILPLPILRTLRTAKCRELAVLTFLFSLGIITLSVSAGRFATMLTLGNDISLYIWATAEFSISQIIVSSMALRPLMQRAWRIVSASTCVGGDDDDVSDSEARRGLSVDVAPPGRRGAPGTGPRRNTSPSCGKRAPNPWSGLTETDIELGEIRDGDCDYQYGADGDSSPQHDDGGAGGERNRSKRNDSGVADLTRSCTSSQHVESERISNVNMIDKGPGL